MVRVGLFVEQAFDEVMIAAANRRDQFPRFRRRWRRFVARRFGFGNFAFLLLGVNLFLLLRDHRHHDRHRQADHTHDQRQQQAAQPSSTRQFDNRPRIVCRLSLRSRTCRLGNRRHCRVDLPPPRGGILHLRTRRHRQRLRQRLALSRITAACHRPGHLRAVARSRSAGRIVAELKIVVRWFAAHAALKKSAKGRRNRTATVRQCCYIQSNWAKCACQQGRSGQAAINPLLVNDHTRAGLTSIRQQIWRRQLTASAIPIAGNPLHHHFSFASAAFSAAFTTSAIATGLPPCRLLSSAVSINANNSSVSLAATGGLCVRKNFAISATSGA